MNVGDVDYSQGDVRPPRQLNFEGGNDYSVQVGNVILDTEMRGTGSASTGGNQRLRGNTAAVEITGTIKQVDGNSGTETNSHNFFLGGTNTGNVVSGVIADADDFTSGSNLDARALNINKGESGTWTLTGVNTYTGNTMITDGTLEIGGAGQLGAGDYSGDIGIDAGASFVVNSTADQILNGAISGDGTLGKDNSGSLTLTGTNTYMGATTVDAGALIINGDNSGASGPLTVVGGTLGGDGTIGGDTLVDSGAFLSPGSAVAAGTVGDLAFSGAGGLDISGAAGGTGAFLFDLGAGLANDQVLLTGGMLDIGSGFLNFDDFAFNDLGVVAGTYTLFDSDSSILGTLGSSLTGTIGGFDAVIELADSGNDIVLTLAIVPEPSRTILLLIGGLFGLLHRRRSRV